MNVQHVVNVVSVVLVALAVAMTLTAGVSLAYADGDFTAFALAAVGTAGVGVLGYRLSSISRDLSVREGYAVVAFAWLATGVAGALPYLLAGVVDSPMAALFESVSGFTTTGATIFADIEALPHGILFWRSFTQWLGGMGIIVLGIAILPFLGVGGMQLFRAEVPGPTPERLQPRIAQTAKILWLVYAGITGMQVVLYLVGGLSLFEAVTHAFSTMSTGGFSPRAASIAAYESAYIQYVTIVFMFVAGVNFALHYRAIGSRGRVYLHDSELRFFAGVILTLTLLITAAVLLFPAAPGAGLERTFRDALFQVVSIGTTTGFATADYELWPLFAQLLLVGIMFIGAMSGSTSGGAKMIRAHVLVRHILAELRKAIHPRAVVITRVGKRTIQEDTLLSVLGFLLLFVLLFVAGVLVLALLGHDLATAVGASIASLGNIGPGIGAVGPMENYGWMGAPTQVVLMFLMLVGRLEIFTILLLFHPDLWRSARWR